MKKYIILVALSLSCQLGFSQAFELQLVLNSETNMLTVQMKNVSATANNPATGETISTLSFEMTGQALVTGVASTNYTLLAPNGSGQVVMSSTGLPAPENWPIDAWITVANYNVDVSSTVADFVVTPDTDGDNSDPTDPVMSVLTASGFNQSVTIQGTILPIKLERFNANKSNNNVLLDWITSSEINGSHFEIERSQDLDNWIKVGTVDAVGESSTDQSYDFLDNNLPLNSRSAHKVFYYRLNMVDNDGSSEYSDTRSVRFDLDGEADFLVYPNPSINEVYVNLSSITPETGPASLNITNVNGQLVKKVTLTSSDDVRVDLSDFNSGVYYFVVRQGEQTFAQKVIKVD